MLKNTMIKQPTEEDPDEGIKDLVETMVKKMVSLYVCIRLVWPARPIPPLLFYLLRFICKLYKINVHILIGGGIGSSIILPLPCLALSPYSSNFFFQFFNVARWK